jgi:predicted transcriptional regulator
MVGQVGTTKVQSLSQDVTRESEPGKCMARWRIMYGLLSTETVKHMHHSAG